MFQDVKFDLLFHALLPMPLLKPLFQARLSTSEPSSCEYLWNWNWHKVQDSYLGVEILVVVVRLPPSHGH